MNATSIGSVAELTKLATSVRLVAYGDTGTLIFRACSSGNLESIGYCAASCENIDLVEQLRPDLAQLI